MFQELHDILRCLPTLPVTNIQNLWYENYSWPPPPHSLSLPRDSFGTSMSVSPEVYSKIASQPFSKYLLKPKRSRFFTMLRSTQQSYSLLPRDEGHSVRSIYARPKPTTHKGRTVYSLMEEQLITCQLRTRNLQRWWCWLHWINLSNRANVHYNQLTTL